MKPLLLASTLICLLAACTEPKMKLRANEPNAEEKKEIVATKPDSVIADTTKLAVKDY